MTFMRKWSSKRQRADRSEAFQMVIVLGLFFSANDDMYDTIEEVEEIVKEMKSITTDPETLARIEAKANLLRNRFQGGSNEAQV